MTRFVEARKRSLPTMLLAAGLSLVAGLACAQPPTIEIGLVAPLTELLTEEGNLSRQAGIDIVGAINRSGGLGGRKVSLRIEDDGYAWIPLIVPNASFSELGDKASRYVFSVGVRPDGLAEAAVRLIRERALGQRIGAISDGSPIAEEAIRELSRRAEVVYVFRLGTGQTPSAYQELQRRIKAEALFVATGKPDEFVPYLRQSPNVPVILAGLPTASRESWRAFWELADSERSRMFVVTLAAARPTSKWGSEVFSQWVRKNRTTPPDAYSEAVKKLTFTIVSH